MRPTAPLTRAEPPSGSGRRKSLWIAAGAYLLFVVYGSLVPLDFHPRPLDSAWQDFLETSYLTLGVESRADWVANILLYIPLAYLLCAGVLTGVRSAIARLIAVAAVFVVCAAVALGVEFTQLFFPPRTVSLNDIVAEFIGTTLGIGVWLVWGRGAGAALGGHDARRFAGDPRRRGRVRGGLSGVQSLSVRFSRLGTGVRGEILREQLPIARDFCHVRPVVVVRREDLRRNRRRGSARACCSGWRWASPQGESMRPLRFAALCSVSRSRRRNSSWRRAYRKGVSLLTRAAGLPLGVALSRHVHLDNLAVLRPYIVRALLAAIPVYLVVLIWANAWFGAHWLGVGPARAKLDGVHWLPFYYHYFSTETHALRSLLAVAAMYLPVGFGYWMWTLRATPAAAHGSALIPALIAASLAAMMEMGKLFLPGKHPDPTDVLIAMAAATGAYLVATMVYRWAVQHESALAPPARSDVPQGGSLPSTAASNPVRRAGGDPAGGRRRHRDLALPAGRRLADAGARVVRGRVVAPPGTLPAGGPRAAAVARPFAVERLDPAERIRPPDGGDARGTPASQAGRCRDVRHCPVVPESRSVWSRHRSSRARWSGSFRCQPSTPMRSVAYYTSFSSLRQLKGFAWALALLPLLMEEARNELRMEQRWMAGMLAGLCGVVAAILYQRMEFAGLADFATVYRVEGTFPELHTGGGDVHAYLVMAIPFVVAWIALKPAMPRVVLGTLLFALASYALGVTFTRGGYIGYVGAIAVLGVAFVLRWWRPGARKPRGIAVAIVLALVGIAILVPIVTGSFMAARLAGTQREAVTRTGHWARALNMMDPGVSTVLLGMGLGAFPRTMLFKDPDAASATFSYARERDNGFVRLGSGRPLYLDQRVAVAPGTSYTLSLDLRSAQANAKADVALCEKSIQYSFQCKWMSFPIKAGSTWEHNEATFDTGHIGAGRGQLGRPVALGLTNFQRGSIVEVDNVRLLDAAGRDLIANGDFSQGGARWFFAADDHLPWHIFSLWVQILFEQGWIGVFALVVAVATSLARLAMGMSRGDLFAATLLAALVGFLLVGLTESLFDGPRVTTMFFLLLFTGLLHPVRRKNALAATDNAGIRREMLD